MPVGFHALHPDVSLNFQMNRWWSWVGEDGMLAQLRSVAPAIRDYADWKRCFVDLARTAEREGHRTRAAYYWRSADFFMLPDDPDREPARTRCLQLLREQHGLSPSDYRRVAYGDGDRDGWLSALRLPADGSRRDTIVFFGGFDSYLEELLPALRFMQRRGFDVIAFEGPGQGTTLNEAGLRMTADWHRPLGAVLDHFDVRDATAIGLSLGGCLVIRAAALEPRIRRVVAWDILTDFLEVNLRQAGPLLGWLVKVLLDAGANGIVDRIATVAAWRSPVRRWGLAQGRHVTGIERPHAFLREVRRYRTDDLSDRLDQDVLLLAGAEDHFVPLAQLQRQHDMLSRARSVTVRVFTAAEHAASHCQVGNYGLALEVIVDWLESTLRH